MSATIDEVIELANLTKWLSFSIKESESGPGPWRIYDGQYRLHMMQEDIQLVYLGSSVTNDEMNDAKRATKKNSSLHVVYAESIKKKPSDIKRHFGDGAKVCLTVGQYIRSLFQSESEEYARQMSSLADDDYVQPRVRNPSCTMVNNDGPLQRFFTSPEASFTNKVGVLLAEPGQGKTYLTKNLASEIVKSRKTIPIYVSSNQWKNLGLEDFSSVWKTVVNSFGFYGGYIGWLNGVEEKFVKVVLKEKLFVIIFDGFDEYVLKNSGQLTAKDVIRSLNEIVEESGARILITSRNTFWKQEIDETLESQSCTVYKIEPFDGTKARNYFSLKSNGDESVVHRASSLYADLFSAAPDLVGRGFVLKLIADVAKDETLSRFSGGSPIQFLMLSLCEREQRRQGLPLSPDSQMKIIGLFVSEVICGAKPDDDLLFTCIGVVEDGFGVDYQKACIDKMQPHPLIHREPSGEWISEEQVEAYLLADIIIKAVYEGDKGVMKRLNYDHSLSEGRLDDLAQAIIESIRYSEQYDLSAFVKKFCEVRVDLIPDEVEGNINAPLVGVITFKCALAAVNDALGDGAPHREKAMMLLDVYGSESFTNVHFWGQVSGFDFSQFSFVGCVFDKVRWVNCDFDDKTVFSDCKLISGSQVRSKGLGLAEMIDPVFEDGAMEFIEGERVKSGARKFTKDMLHRIVRDVIDRFATKNRLGFKTIKSKDLKTGTLRNMPKKDEIIDELKKDVLQEFPGSSGVGKGMKIRDSALDGAKFLVENSTFVGPIKDAVMRLEKKLL